MANTVCWSNGNLFRCITLLAVHLQQAGIVRIAWSTRRVKLVLLMGWCVVADMKHVLVSGVFCIGADA